MKNVSANAQTEVDSQQNKPIELYDLYLDNETVHLTDYHDSVDFFDPDGVATTYLPVPLERGSIEQDVVAKAMKLTVRWGNVNRGFTAYEQANEMRGKKVTIRRVFRDAMASVNDAVTLMKNGLIDSYQISEAWMEAVIATSIGTLNLEAPKWHYQLLCNRKLGDAGCGVDLTHADNKKTKSCGSGSTTLIVNSSGLTEADDYWIDGEIRFTSGNLNGQKRRVIDSENGNLTVQFALTEAPQSGDTFIVIRGCDKTIANCENRFSNKINYGGFDTIPQEMVRR